jgi:hypothetical protein
MADELRERRLTVLAGLKERARAAGIELETGDVWWERGTAAPLIDRMPADQWLDAMTEE